MVSPPLRPTTPVPLLAQIPAPVVTIRSQIQQTRPPNSHVPMSTPLSKSPPPSASRSAFKKHSQSKEHPSLHLSYACADAGPGSVRDFTTGVPFWFFSLLRHLRVPLGRLLPRNFILNSPLVLHIPLASRQAHIRRPIFFGHFQTRQSPPNAPRSHIL